MILKTKGHLSFLVLSTIALVIPALGPETNRLAYIIMVVVDLTQGHQQPPWWLFNYQRISQLHYTKLLHHTTIKNNAGEMSVHVGWQSISFFISGGFVFFGDSTLCEWNAPPGYDIMMVVDALARKGTSTSVNTMATLLQFLYIWVNAKHVTQHIYRITPTKQAMLKTGR